MRSLLSSMPVLWFLFLFNAVVAAAAGFALHGTQQLMTSAGMGVVSLGAGARLFAPPPGAGLTDRNSPAEVSPHGIPYGSRSPPPASSASIVTVLPMERQMNDVLLHYFEHGDGVPLLALHGAGVDHREIAAAIEAIVPRAGYRRIYPDLPGMGRSTTGGLTCNNEVVTLLSDFIEQLGEGPVMLLGHSYGAYLARGIAAQRPDLLLGLALVCPVDERAGNLPDHEVVRQDADAYGELEPAQRAGFDDYFVVRTAATARRYRDDVVPGTTLVDNAALGRIFAGWTVEVGSGTFSAPTLIAAGRRDSVVGYTDAMALLERYPHATLGVVEDAGHALMHERPELLAAFLGDWLDRARPNDK